MIRRPADCGVPAALLARRSEARKRAQGYPWPPGAGSGLLAGSRDMSRLAWYSPEPASNLERRLS